MSVASAVQIRPIAAADEAEWRVLWRGYLDYYETTLPDEVWRTTFGRLTGGRLEEFRGLVAVAEGRLVGLSHFHFHQSSWAVEPVCYLQDLYTAPDQRGRGVARALIEAVYRAADAEGAPGVYWFTQEFSARARRLYDKIGSLTPFVRYNRRMAPASPLSTDIVIRRLEAGDATDWRKLWAGYLAFYEATLSETVTETTFARLLADEPGRMRGRLLLVEGAPAGIVHWVCHRSCWKIENVCYLQDLYALPEHRGRGLGRALIEAVYAEADAAGTPAVYWLTQHFNARARQLYDRIGQLTPFIAYDRPL